MSNLVRKSLIWSVSTLAAVVLVAPGALASPGVNAKAGQTSGAESASTSGAVPEAGDTASGTPSITAAQQIPTTGAAASAQAGEADPEAVVEALAQEGVEVAVAGQFLRLADAPEGEPDSFVQAEEGSLVPVDPSTLDPSVQPGDQVEAVLAVPPGTVQTFDDAVLADLAATSDVAKALDGPLPAGGPAGEVLLEALANGGTETQVSGVAVTQAAASPAGAPGPYQHKLQFVFVSDRGVFWDKDQLDAYAAGLEEFWVRESRGAISGFTYSWDDVVLAQTVAHCGATSAADQLVALTTAAGEALTAAGMRVPLSQNDPELTHLVVLTASGLQSVACRELYLGVAWLGTDLASAGHIHNWVSAGAPPQSLRSDDTFPHEMGHSLGLGHAGALNCPGERLMDGPLAGDGACSVSEYGNGLNVMGQASSVGPINAKQKDIQHLVAEGAGLETVTDPAAAREFVIAPISTQNLEALQAVRIVEGQGAGERTYWLDYYPAVVGGGIGVSRDTSAYFYGGPDSALLCPQGRIGGSFAGVGCSSVFRPGEVFVSETGKTRVEVLSVSPAGARVRVDVFNPAPVLNVSATSWQAPSWGASQAVEVNTGGGAWSAKTTASWLSLANSDGSAGSVFKITANTLSSGSRTGAVVVTSGGASAVIQVAQVAQVDDCAASVQTACAFNTGSPAAAYTVSGTFGAVYDTDYWRFSPPETGEWAFRTASPLAITGTVRNQSGAPLVDSSGTSPRSTTVTRFTGGQVSSHYLHAGTTYYVSVEGMNSNSLVVDGAYTMTASRTDLALSQSAWSPGALAESLTVWVASDSGQFAAQSSADWLTVSPTWTSGSVTALAAQVRVAVNETGAPRSGQVVFQPNSYKTQGGVVLTVTQAGDAAVKVQPGSWAPAGVAAERQVSIQTTGAPWTVSAKPDWVTVDPSGGAAGKATVRVEANAGAAREGVVRFSAGGEVAEFRITQAQHLLSVTPATLSAPGSSWTRSVHSVEVPYGGWSIESKPDWVSVSPGQADGPDQVSLSTDVNPGAARQGDVVFAAGASRASVTVTQAAGGSELSLNSGHLEVAYPGGSREFTVWAANGPWQVDSQPDWVAVSPTSGVSGVSGVLVVTVSPHTGPARSGQIQLSANGETATIWVEQGADLHGNSPATATVMGPVAGSTRYRTGVLEVGEDLDYFAFDAPTTGQYRFYASKTPGVPATVARLYDASGALLATGANSSATMSYNILQSLAAGERYYLAIGNADPLVDFPVSYDLYHYAPAIDLAVAPTSWAAPTAGGSVTAVVSTSLTSWSVTADQDWLSASPDAGASGQAVNLVASANPADVARSGVVVFQAGGLERGFVVTQAAGSLALSKATWSASAAGATTSVRVTSSVPVWSASADVSWLSVTPSGAAGGDVQVVAAKNYGSARTGFVTVRAGDMALKVSVSQAAGPGTTLSLSRSSFSAGAAGGQVSVGVTTNQESWSASADQAWLSVSPSSGVSGGQLVVSASANAGGARSGTVKVVVTGPTGSVARTVTVSQAAGSVPVLTLSASSWAAPPTGGDFDLVVFTNQSPLGVSYSAGWLSHSVEPSAQGAVVAFSAGANPGAARSVTVTVAGGSKSATFRVTQAAGTLTLSPATSWSPGREGGSRVVKVTTNQGAWSVVSSAAWLSVGPAAGGTGDSFTVVAAPNPGAARTASFTVTAGAIVKTIAVSQAAATLTSSPASWSPAWGGALEVFQINASVGVWRLDASGVPDWLELSPAAGADHVSGDRQVVRATRNEGAARQATLVFKAGELTREVVVKQAAAPAASVSLSPTLWSAPPEVGSLGVQVAVNRAAWAASADQGWVSVPEGAQPAGGLLVLGVDPNPTGQTRTATVTVTAASAVRTFKVTQAAGPATRSAAWSSADVLELSRLAQSAGWSSGLSGYGSLSVSDDVSWLSASANPSTGQVSATATVNNGSARRGLVTVRAGAKVVATLVVFQAGVPQVYAGAATWTVAAGGGEVTRTVDATGPGFAPVAWQAATDAGWLHVAPGQNPSGSGLVIAADPNLSGAVRTATITVTGGEETTTITVTQRA
ncbi:MAG: hypothetical protein LBS27_10315 [Bifidobacteriaceae bacterium]|jgi:hypothetical protein|nr:hypothetical protein [Bifidobacteriaceae bacterium]